MRILLLTMFVAAGLAFDVCGQGVVIGNGANTSLDSAATSNGLVWTNEGPGQVGLWDGLQYDLGIEVWGGSSSTSLSPIVTLLPDPAHGVRTGSDYGKFTPAGLPSVFDIPGVASQGTAWVELRVWQWQWSGGPYTNYVAAEAGGDLAGVVVFQNPTGGPTPCPSVPAQTLTGMPVLILIIPEPSTLALGTLSVVTWLLVRRRKQVASPLRV